MVLISFADAVVGRFVADIARAIPVDVRRSERHPRDLPNDDDVSRAAALVWDMDGGSETALADLRRLRRLRPGLPILLYLPASPHAVGLTAAALEVAPNALVCSQSGGPQDLERIRDFIRSAEKREPATRASEIALSIVDPSTGVIRRFIRVATRGYLEGTPATVQSVSATMELSERQLRWRWPAAAPRPKELLGWLECLVIASLAVTERIPVNTAARRMGRNAKGLARLPSVPAAKWRPRCSSSRRARSRAVRSSAPTVPLAAAGAEPRPWPRTRTLAPTRLALAQVAVGNPNLPVAIRSGARFQPQRRGIDAVAQPRRIGAIIEHVPEVRIAARAERLRAAHAMTRVRPLQRDRRIVAGLGTAHDHRVVPHRPAGESHLPREHRGSALADHDEVLAVMRVAPGVRARRASVSSVRWGRRGG